MSDDDANPDRVTLVGECNPYGADPEYALYPYPSGCSGSRLRRIMGVPTDRYLAFRRVNLCSGVFSVSHARTAAALFRSSLVEHAASPSRDVVDLPLVVLLGRRVSRAFSGMFPDDEPPAVWGRLLDSSGAASWVSLPHPSGLCRVWGHGMWSVGGSVQRAREVLASCCPRVGWGSDPECRLHGSPRVSGP